MSNILYDDFQELDVEEEPNETGILIFSKGFSVPEEDQGDFFMRSMENAAGEIGIQMAKAGLFEVEQVGSPYAENGYVMGPEFEDFYKLHARIMPSPSSCVERNRELQEENDKLRRRVASLEDTLYEIKKML